MPRGARPEEMNEWLANKRTFKTIKAIRSLSAFETRFFRWWTDVQPSERAKKEDGFCAQVDDGVDWDRIRFTGRNGLVNVVVALFFWGMALGSEEARRDAVGWHKALKDVKFVLGHLVRSAAGSTVAFAQAKGHDTSGGTPNGVIVEKENHSLKRKRTETEKGMALVEATREKEAKRMATQKRYGVFRCSIAIQAHLVYLQGSCRTACNSTLSSPSPPLFQSPAASLPAIQVLQPPCFPLVEAMYIIPACE